MNIADLSNSTLAPLHLAPALPPLMLSTPHSQRLVYLHTPSPYPGNALDILPACLPASHSPAAQQPIRAEPCIQATLRNGRLQTHLNPNHQCLCQCKSVQCTWADLTCPGLPLPDHSFTNITLRLDAHCGSCEACGKWISSIVTPTHIEQGQLLHCT